MKRFGWIVLFAFGISFCCACNAVTPGPCTTGSSASVVTAREEESSEEETEAPSTEAVEATTEAATEAVEGDLVRATTGVNIRDAADKDSNVVGSLSEGETITCVGEAGSWSIVMYEGSECYVYSKYLEPAE